MSPLNPIQPDERTFAAFAPTEAFLVGPHSLFRFDGNSVLNDRTALECFWVEEMTGFDSSDIVATAQASAGEDGELPDPGSLGGRTMGLSGWIQAGSYPRMIDMGRELLDMFLGVRDERELLITTHPDSFFTHDDMTIQCRPSDRPTLSTRIEQSDMSGLIKRSFSISLRAHLDPTYQSTELKYKAFVPQVTNVKGRAYDRSYDLAYNVSLGANDEPVVGGNTFEVVNAGNYDASPVIRFNGRMNGVVLTNRTTGHAIRLLGQIDAGDSLTIDIKTGEITDAAGRRADRRFNSRSDWLRLGGTRTVAGGANELEISLSSFDSSASVELWWRDTNL